jgi:hypothetical protein
VAAAAIAGQRRRARTAAAAAARLRFARKERSQFCVVTSGMWRVHAGVKLYVDHRAAVLAPHQQTLANFRLGRVLQSWHISSTECFDPVWGHQPVARPQGKKRDKVKHAKKKGQEHLSVDKRAQRLARQLALFSAGTSLGITTAHDAGMGASFKFQTPQHFASWQALQCNARQADALLHQPVVIQHHSDAFRWLWQGRQLGSMATGFVTASGWWLPFGGSNQQAGGHSLRWNALQWRTRSLYAASRSGVTI